MEKRKLVLNVDMLSGFSELPKEQAATPNLLGDTSLKVVLETIAAPEVEFYCSETTGTCGAITAQITDAVGDVIETSTPSNQPFRSRSYTFQLEKGMRVKTIKAAFSDVFNRMRTEIDRFPNDPVTLSSPLHCTAFPESLSDVSQNVFFIRHGRKTEALVAPSFSLDTQALAGEYLARVLREIRTPLSKTDQSVFDKHGFALAANHETSVAQMVGRFSIFLRTLTESLSGKQFEFQESQGCRVISDRDLEKLWTQRKSTWFLTSDYNGEMLQATSYANIGGVLEARVSVDQILAEVSLFDSEQKDEFARRLVDEVEGMERAFLPQVHRQQFLIQSEYESLTGKELIDLLVENHGMSVREISRKLGKTHSVLASIDSGRTKQPHADLWIALKNLLLEKELSGK